MVKTLLLQLILLERCANIYQCASNSHYTISHYTKSFNFEFVFMNIFISLKIVVKGLDLSRAVAIFKIHRGNPSMGSVTQRYKKQFSNNKSFNSPCKKKLATQNIFFMLRAGIPSQIFYCSLNNIQCN